LDHTRDLMKRDWFAVLVIVIDVIIVLAAAVLAYSVFQNG
jgi:hypothetical protein